MIAKQMSAKERKAWEEWQETCKRIRDGKQPPKGETEQQKQKRIKRLLKTQNFEKFCQYYFSDFASAPFAWFHHAAVNDVIGNKEPLNIWEWSRESAKSVFADVFVACHYLFTGWLDGMILASENEEKAKILLNDIEAQLRNNPRIINDFGDFGLTGSWMQGHFSTKDGIGFWAFGLGQNPAGVRNGHRRPNYGVVDDADNKDVAKNQKRTKERADWIKGEFMGCLATQGSVFVYANNRVHKEGLTAHMVGDIEEGDPKNEVYKHIKIYFTEDPESHEMLLLEQGGVPSWKERFTIEDCYRKVKAMGYRNALRQLYHKHIEEGNVFKEEDLPWTDCLPLHMYDNLLSYTDPAFGESGKACYRAIVLVGVTGLNYHIIWAWLRQNGSFAEAQRSLAWRIENSRELSGTTNTVGFKAKIKCTHWVESNELQKIMLRHIYKALNAEKGKPWWPKFDMDKKANKITRIEGMETLAQNGHILFNEEMRKNKDMQTLRDQFLGFPDGYIDGPDAVAGAIAKLEKSRGRRKGKAVVAGKYTKTSKR